MTELFKKHKTELGILFLACMVRLLAVFFVADLSSPDQEEFGHVARNLLAGDGYSIWRYDESEGFNWNVGQPMPSAYMPVLYPWFLASVRFLFGSGETGHAVLYTLHAISGALLCVVVYRIAKFKFDERTSFWGSMCLAVSPVFVYVPTQVSAANVYVLLSMLTVLFVFRFEKSGDAKTSLVAGLLMGFTTLARAQLVLYSSAILVYWLVTRRDRFVRGATTFLIGVAVIMSPWVVRNYLVFERFIPLTTCGPIALYRGYNEGFVGGAGPILPPEIRAELTKLEPSRDFECDLADVFRKAAHEDIWKDPVRSFAILPFKKLFAYWVFDDGYPQTRHPLYWGPWLVILPLFLYGLFRSIPDFREYLLLYMYFLLATVIVMVFFTLPRYRLLVEPFVYLFAVKGLFCLACSPALETTSQTAQSDKQIEQLNA